MSSDPPAASAITPEQVRELYRRFVLELDSKERYGDLPDTAWNPFDKGYTRAINDVLSLASSSRAVKEPLLEQLIVKWRCDAQELDADGDICCSVTRAHDADELEATLTVRPSSARAVKEPDKD